MSDSKNTMNKGFTLVELLIAMTISLIVIASLGTVFLTQLKTYNLQEQLVEMTQNARAAMDFMTREIRMAGYGAPKSDFTDWIDKIGLDVTMDDPIIIDTGNGVLGSDILHVAGCFDNPAGTLSPAASAPAASAGDTSLIVRVPKDLDDDEDTFNSDKKNVISINGLENAVIDSIPSIDSSGTLYNEYTLNIYTNITSNNEGLQNDFQAGDPVYILKVISYSIVQDADGTYVLKRNENLGAGRQPLVENITDLQIEPGNKIKIKARTAEPDPEYSQNNGYRTYELSSYVTPPNLSIADAP